MSTFKSVGIFNQKAIFGKNLIFVITLVGNVINYIRFAPICLLKFLKFHHDDQKYYKTRPVG